MRKVLYILGELNDGDVEWMAQTGRRIVAEAPQVLIVEGEPNARLFFVLEGHARVTVAGIGEVARLGAGEVVGEMSFVDMAPPSATVTMDEGCVVLALDKGLVQARLKQQPDFAGRFYRALAIFLADRLRGLTKRRSGAGSISSPEIAEDELDEGLLDNLSLAGVRFERMLSILQSAAA